MRKSFRQADFGALSKLWNEFHPATYSIDAEILELNTVKSPVFDWGLSQIEVDDGGAILGFISIKRSAASLYKGPSIDQAHLSAVAYTDPRVAVDLVADAKRILRNRGVNRLIFGADSRHFWPGCPTEIGSICGFLMVEGFEEGGEHFDMERDLEGFVPTSKAPPSVQLRTLSGEEDEVSIRVLLEREFSGRWAYDVLEKLRAEQSGDCIVGAFEDGKAIGFAMVQDNSQQLPLGGAVWRCNLGDAWGAIGPIGVAEPHRGRQIGAALMDYSLARLQASGAERCIVDWTTLEDFYSRFGFKKSRVYRSSALRLSD